MPWILKLTRTQPAHTRKLSFVSNQMNRRSEQTLFVLVPWSGTSSQVPAVVHLQLVQKCINRQMLFLTTPHSLKKKKNPAWLRTVDVIGLRNSACCCQRVWSCTVRRVYRSDLSKPNEATATLSRPGLPVCGASLPTTRSLSLFLHIPCAGRLHWGLQSAIFQCLT